MSVRASPGEFVPRERPATGRRAENRFWTPSMRVDPVAELVFPSLDDRGSGVPPGWSFDRCVLSIIEPDDVGYSGSAFRK